MDSVLPPGQRPVRGFPRFGTHLHEPPPAVPPEPAIAIGGAVRAPLTVPATALAELPRRESTAALHCVAGWSALGLTWEGAGFAGFYRAVVAPAVRPGAVVTHLVFVGLDGYRCVAALEDALADDVLLAERLDGRPLDGDHGAPLRLISPQQYAFVSVKHLCAIELHTTEPRENFGHASALAGALMLPPLFKRHPRSRVRYEERNGALPARVVRPLYRLLTPPIAWLSARGSAARRRP